MSRQDRGHPKREEEGEPVPAPIAYASMPEKKEGGSEESEVSPSIKKKRKKRKKKKKKGGAQEASNTANVPEPPLEQEERRPAVQANEPDYETLHQRIPSFRVGLAEPRPPVAFASLMAQRERHSMEERAEIVRQAKASHFWSSANNSIRSLRRMLITSFKVEHSLRSATRSPTNSRKDVAPSKEAIYVSSNYCPSFIFYSESESDPGE